MFKKIIRSLVLVSFLVPGLAGAAVTDEDFVLTTTQNLVNLCSVSADDPRAKEAIQMCEGYMLGAYHFYVATNSGKRQICGWFVCPIHRLRAMKRSPCSWSGLRPIRNT